MLETYGILKKNNELIEIFEDGRVPLKHPIIEGGKGREDQEIDFYVVDLDALTSEQINAVVEVFEKKMGIKADEKTLRAEGFRILTKHFAWVSFNARWIS